MQLADLDHLATLGEDVLEQEAVHLGVGVGARV